jgi:hypothetical protein
MSVITLSQDSSLARLFRNCHLPKKTLVNSDEKAECPLGIAEVNDSMEDIKVELIVQMLIGDKEELISGNRPNQKTKALINDIVVRYMRDSLPIPILIAISPSKLESTWHPLCLGEIEFIRILKACQERVKIVYSPGIDFCLRIEDATGMICFKGDNEDKKILFESYYTSLLAVIKMAKMEDCVTIRKETELMEWESFQDLALKIHGDVFRYVQTRDTDEAEGRDVTDEQQEILQNIQTQYGWKGDISKEWQQFMIKRYCKMSQVDSSTAAIVNDNFSRYTACIMARKLLNGYGAKPEWIHGKLDISMVPAMPGALTAPRLYYRSVPTWKFKTNCPYWKMRTVGHVNGNKLVLKLIQVDCLDEDNLRLHRICFESTGVTLGVWLDRKLEVGSKIEQVVDEYTSLPLLWDL